MFLTNGGITVEAVHPSDIRRLLQAGYTKVQDEPKSERATGSYIKQPVKTTGKGSEQ